MANRALFLNELLRYKCISMSVYFLTIDWRALSNNLLESSNKAFLYRTSIHSGVFTRIGYPGYRISDIRISGGIHSRQTARVEPGRNPRKKQNKKLTLVRKLFSDKLIWFELPRVLFLLHENDFLKTGIPLGKIRNKN